MRTPGTGLLLVILIAAGALVGCGASSGPVDAWVRRGGGLCTDGQERVTTLAARLAAGAGIPAPVDVRVLNAPALAAYSWPGGRVFVTRGLVDVADDDELAAAIAHELAHLLVDGDNGHDAKVAALKGRAKGEADVETRADLVGRELLVRGGYEPDAMRRLLMKVAAATPKESSPRFRAHLRSRITKLAPPAAPVISHAHAGGAHP